MMDVIVPGGTTRDIAPDGAAACAPCSTRYGRFFRGWLSSTTIRPSLLDRTVTTGIVRADYVRQFGAGGYVGRASGRNFDARRNPGYAPYNELKFEVPVLVEGDVNARVWIRIREVEQSLALIGQILDAMPKGDVRTPVRGGGGEGFGSRRGFPRRCAGLAAARWGRMRGALPSARRLLVSVAAAWRRQSKATSSPTSRFATNPSTVLIRGTIFRCGGRCSKALTFGPLTEPAPKPEAAALKELAQVRRPRLARQARTLAIDPSGRCRFLQRLRVGNPCFEQCVLRSRTLRPAFRRLAAPCRRVAGDRAGDQEYVRGAAANL